jgi:hypothetical protein
VDKCDLFLGIITPYYGSGQDPKKLEEPSIVHQEMRRAIELKKPRWILAHDHVVFARGLLANLGFKGKDGRKKLTLKKKPILDDLRVLDLYEEATIDGAETPLADRDGNWVQKFQNTEDGSLFVGSQFFRYQEVERFIEENFASGAPLALKGGEA